MKSNFLGSPHFLSSTLSFSLFPIGALSEGRLGIKFKAVSYSSSIFLSSGSLALSSSLIFLPSSIFFSSATLFLFALSSSTSTINCLLFPSNLITSSTILGSSCLAATPFLTFSVFSRINSMSSITCILTKISSVFLPRGPYGYIFRVLPHLVGHKFFPVWE